MSSDAVDAIKQKLSIVEVVAPYVELMPAGKNLKGKSPFTNERTPSFYVSPDRGMFYCFSSNQGGDIFTFIQLVEGVDFRGALKQLAERAGVPLVAERPEARGERAAQYALLEAATIFYQESLTSAAGAYDYLSERGLTPETISRWRIGFAGGPESGAGWRSLSEAMQGQGFSTDQLLKVGLVKGAEAGKAPYDVFRDRIMFPLFDASGRVVAFSGRLYGEAEAPKYVNSPETELYRKSELLFGYDRAKEGIRKLGFSMIVEGQFDVVMSHQAGYVNTVAVSGTALTAHHVDLLQRLSQKVVLALDSDRAGIAALEKAAHLMLQRGMDVKVVRLPDGSDPADIIKTDPAAFKRAVGEAVHVIEFLLSHLRTTGKDVRLYTLNVRERVIPFLARMPSALEREHFVGVIAEALDSTKEAVRLELDRVFETERKRDGTTAENQMQSEMQPVASQGSKNDLAGQIHEYACFIAAALSHFDEAVQQRALGPLEEQLPGVITEILTTSTPEVRSRWSFEVDNDFEHVPVKNHVLVLEDKVNTLLQLLIKKQILELKQEGTKGDSLLDSAVSDAHVRRNELAKLKHVRITLGS